MKKTIQIRESELKGLIRECVLKAMNETILGPGEKFKPFTQAEKKRNFAPYDPEQQDQLPSMEKRNPSYAKALKAAQERMAAKKKDSLEEKNNSGIVIDPENKDKFKETMKRTGKTAEQLKKSKNPLTRKRATFAINAAKWNKDK